MGTTPISRNVLLLVKSREEFCKEQSYSVTRQFQVVIRSIVQYGSFAILDMAHVTSSSVI